MIKNKLNRILTKVMALKFSGIITEAQYNGIVYPLMDAGGDAQEQKAVPVKRKRRSNKTRPKSKRKYSPRKKTTNDK